MNLLQAAFLNLILALGVCASGLAQPPQYPVQSASGQFCVLNGILSGSFTRINLTTDEDLLHLEPTLLAVSAERVRQKLTRLLQDESPWQGRVLFNLRPTETLEASAKVVAEWNGRQWQYQTSLPDYMKRDQFIRTLVEIDLMEMANRTSTGRTTDVPVWLTDGLTGVLLASHSIELILPPPKLEVGGMHVTPFLVENRAYQPLAQAHAQLQTGAPLSIEQLSWPSAETFRGGRGRTFRSCAQLLVTRLLELPDGPAMMTVFIQNMGRHYNWQVAFLNAWQNQFSSLRDLEKWWAIEVAYFTGRELGTIYSYADSVTQLKQVMHFPVEVRLHPNDAPMHSEVRLQTVIEEWDVERQERAIHETLVELALLRSRVAPGLITLLDDYRLTLEGYLRSRNSKGLYLPRGINRQVALNAVVLRTLKKLDELDAELEALLPEPAANASLAESRR